MTTAERILSELLPALPQRRDWLDPVLEARMKEAVKEAEGHRDTIGEHWPTPWFNETESGCFGTIMAANGEPVAQVQMLNPKYIGDVVKRNEWRNIQARRISQAVNERAAILDLLADLIGDATEEDIAGQADGNAFGEISFGDVRRIRELLTQAGRLAKVKKS